MNILPAMFTEAEPGLDSPDVIRMQPLPVATRSCRFRTPGGQVVTAIVRQWKPGDSGPQGRCRLCPECSAYDDCCLMTIGRHVTAEDAPLVSVNGLRLQRQP
jgi:hypothetical protein